MGTLYTIADLKKSALKLKILYFLKRFYSVMLIFPTIGKGSF